MVPRNVCRRVDVDGVAVLAKKTATAITMKC